MSKTLLFSRISIKSLAFMSALTASCVFSQPTLAGFEWVPSPKPQPVEALPPMPEETYSVNNSTDNTPIQIRRQAIQPSEVPAEKPYIYDSAPVKLAPVAPVTTAQPDSEENLKKPPFKADNTRIIMQEDAPQTAIDQVGSFQPPEPLNVEYGTAGNPPVSQPPFDSKPIMVPDFPGTTMPPQPAVEPQKTAMPLTPAPALAPPAPAKQKDIAVGFANDVPLVMALRQIAPANYAFSFSDNVNPGIRVSWNGGKPWDVVIAEMLAPLGYGLVIQDHVIIVRQDTQEQAAIESLQHIAPAAGDVGSSIKEAQQKRHVQRIEDDTPSKL